ncbi:MAG: valine--tRNA ligase [Candidatus Pacebacteria bacterium]|nr:valine--tRNA ligase [Candidatus Paceibacterota bacterium]
MSIPEKFLRPYDPNAAEDATYKMWEDSGYFNPDNLPVLSTAQGPKERTEAWCTIMPPPNANGRLHAGHGTDLALKDIMTRYHRMSGKKALMLPGSDHAGFETQSVFEKKLQKEGRSRFGISDKELYKEIYDFVMESKHIMENDVRKLGTSCDWSRNIFTLDKQVVSKVRDTFKKMYDDGLVYRGKRSIHWNPKFKTSLSDIETISENRKDPFYYFQYGPFVIGTTRPETKFGDKYVVMHPDDKRYTKYKHGDTFECEWINGKITATIIKDEASDPEMGSGVMTITPWHSQIDFEIAQRHNLDYEQIIDWDGKLMDIAGEFAGKKIAMVREDIVKKLDNKGLLIKVDREYEHAVRLCERTGVIVEPQIKDQWFIKMDSLAKKVLEVLDNDDVKILTSRHENMMRHWMNNSIDWNISRQIVWGIQIPAWFKNKDTEDEEIVVSKNKPDGDGWVQDPDTFDTWFSSGQWPLITLGYPDGKDMDYYPTNVMETGADLVFKWIPRMIMFGTYLTGKVPFKTVYFHGMVLDAKGKKMSKSKGNTLSPIELSDEFGTDATRMSFVVSNAPGADMPLSKDKVRAYKKFANKIWNITRFILTEVDGVDTQSQPPLTDTDKRYLKDLQEVSDFISDHIERYRLDLAADKIYHYIWHELADRILEESKIILADDNADTKLSRQYTLYTILTTSLKLLHPFMPFITEEIWQSLPEQHGEKMLMVAKWPMVE